MDKGRTILIVLTDDATQRDLARRIFEEAGAESVDAARRQWGTGLLDAEAQIYHGEDHGAEKRSEAYQRGFETALHPEHYGRSYQTAKIDLRRQYGDVCDYADFRHGYEQGRNYSEHIWEKWRQAVFETPKTQENQQSRKG